VREADGGWLLTGAPVGMPTEEAARIVRLRRFSGARPDHEAFERRALPQTGRIAELTDELAALREDTARRAQDSAALRQHTHELLERLRAARGRRVE
jgi:hypothetical protein